MHRKNGRAGVDGIDVAVGHVLRNRSAAALIDLAELARLPDDVVVGKDPAQLADDLGGGVVAAGFAARAGELANADAVIGAGAVAVGVLAHFPERRIVGVADVRADAEAVGKAVAQPHVLLLAEILHERLKGVALHAGNAHRADLFLVGENAHGGALRHFGVENGFELGIGAHAVVLTVAADERAVHADVARLKTRHDLQLGGEEVLLRDAVAVVQKRHDREHHALAALPGVGNAAGENVQILARNDVRAVLGHLILRKMRQQVGDREFGIVRILADDDLDGFAVLLRHNAVNFERDGDPLVFLDAAVIMRFEKADLVLFVEGNGLEIKTRGIDVRRGDVCAVLKRFAAHNGEHERLAAHALIYLRARLEHHTALIRYKAERLGLRNGLGHGLALGARGVQIRPVCRGVFLQLDPLCNVNDVVALLLPVKERFPQSVQFFFFHNTCILSGFVFISTDAEKLPAFGFQFFLRAVVLQQIIAAHFIVFVVRLRLDARERIVRVDAVARHDTRAAFVSRRGDAHGEHAVLGNAAFKKRDGVHNGNGAAVPDILA